MPGFFVSKGKFMLWIDKLRIFPRLALVCYFMGCATALSWYFDFDVRYETKCDPETIQVALDSGSDLKAAQSLGCTTVSAIGRPHGYTALMTIIVGAGPAIFGLYVNSGPRKEED